MNVLNAPIFNIRPLTVAQSVLRQHFDDSAAIEHDLDRVSTGSGSANGERIWIFIDNSTVTRKGDNNYIPE